MRVPQNLYKFVVPDRVDILKNQSIRFTQPDALNDPFELQPVFDELLPEESIQKALDPPSDLLEEKLRKQHAMWSDADRAFMPVESMLAFFRSNRNQLLKRALDRVEPVLRSGHTALAPLVRESLTQNFQESIGILSLSEDLENPLLWAHYALGHKGFAVEFDTTHKFFHRQRSAKDELFHLRRVKYLERSRSGRTLKDVDGDDIFVTKGSAWAYEAEWRMLVPLKDADSVIRAKEDEVYLFAVPPAAISAVVLGARASNSLEAELQQQLALSHFRHVQLRKATLDESNLRIAACKLS